MASIPIDTSFQNYVNVSALVGGTFFLLNEDVFEDSIGDAENGSRIPSLCFLIKHEKYGNFMFDLGLRKVRSPSY